MFEHMAMPEPWATLGLGFFASWMWARLGASWERNKWLRAAKKRTPMSTLDGRAFFVQEYFPPEAKAVALVKP